VQLHSIRFPRIRDYFSNIPNNILTYGIMPTCKRCVYQKSREPVLIFSRDRGVRIVIYPDGKTYVRLDGCLGYSSCGKCFEQCLSNQESLPCKWKSL
jgi:hypothetical protein